MYLRNQSMNQLCLFCDSIVQGIAFFTPLPLWLAEETLDEQCQRMDHPAKLEPLTLAESCTRRLEEDLYCIIPPECPPDDPTRH